MRKNIKALLLVVLALTVVFSLVACGHQHTFDSAWQSNETHHWQAATCKHDVKNNEAEHNFNAAGRCIVCNYVKPHTCTFGEWQVETPATMLQAGSEYRVCSDPTCNLRETRTTEKVAVASIAITTLPTKVSYVPGETFDVTGMVVTATGADNSTLDVTTLVTVDKTGALTVEDTKVVVSWEGKNAELEIVVAEIPVIPTVSVTEARTTVENGTLVIVEGLFVGVYDEGAGFSNKGILLKDVANDNLISVSDLPESYGTWPNVGYEKGDKVRLYATLLHETFEGEDATSNHTENKKSLVFNAESNPADIKDTVVSQNNLVSYKLENITTLETWADWQAFFVGPQIENYTYVRIKGTVYLNKYTKASDGVTLFRLHPNTAFTDLATMQPSAHRAVGWRNSALEANIGGAWDSYFAGVSWSTNSNDGYSKTKTMDVDFVTVLTSVNGINYQMTVLKAGWLKGNDQGPATQTNQDIVMEMANAYLRQEGQLEYDQYSNRRMTFATPEEATAQELGYFDCSSYVTSVFVNSFGIDAIPFGMWQSTLYYTEYVREHVGQEGFADAVKYWEALDYTTEEEQLACLDEVKSLLQPGDILVYRHGDKEYGANYKESNLRGHAMLYMGNNMFSHSRGTSYQGNKGETGMTYRNDPTKAIDTANGSEHAEGTVQWLDGNKEVFKIGTGSRMLFGNRDDMIYNFSILRPLARTCETPTLTEQMAKRLTVAGLSFEKLTSAGINSGVTRGQEITYTLEVTNHYGNEHTNVQFKDVLPQGVSFVSSNFGAVANGNEIVGTFNVEGRETVKLTWTVRVNDNAEIGSKICNETTINGLLMKDITNVVVGYTQEQFNALATKAREFATSGATFDDPLAFAREVYKQALGVDMFGAETAKTLLADLGVSTKDPAEMFYNKFNNEGEYSTMVAPNMYGGWDYYSGGDYANNNLIRTPYEHNLNLGDVIVCKWYENTRVYIYVGDGELVVIDSLTKTCELVENGNEGWVKGSVLKETYTFKKLTDGNYYQAHLLGTLYAYQSYAVLRPAQLAQ